MKNNQDIPENIEFNQPVGKENQVKEKASTSWTDTILAGLVMGSVMGIGYSVNRFVGMALFIIVFLPGLAALSPTTRKVMAFLVAIFGIFLGAFVYALVMGMF